MKSNAAKSKQSTASKSASSSTRSRRPTSVPKSNLPSHDQPNADELDGLIDRTEDTALESEAGDRILEATGTDSGMPRTTVLEPELKSAEHSAFEEEKSAVAIDAFGNIKSDCPDDADCGEVQHLAEPSGQLNLLEWDSNEPPEPDDFPGDLAAFKAAYLAWVDNQEGTAEEEYQHVDAEDIWNQSGIGIGLTCAAELVSASPMQESSNGDAAPTSLSNGMTTAEKSCNDDSPTANNIAMSKAWTLGEVSLKTSILLPHRHPVPHSQLMESDLEPTTIETVSPPSSPQSNNSSPTLQSSKTLPDCLPVPTNQNLNQEPDLTSDISSGNLPSAGTMSNGKLSAAPILERPGVGKGSLLLRSPGAMSGDKNKRPPGQTRLDNQLKELELIQDGEVVAPEFLENGYQLPMGWTNPEETRTAIELSQIQAQQLPTKHNSELLPEMESTAIVESHSEMPLIGELQPSDSVELNTLPDLSNLGFFSKESLIEFASAAHISIGFIERKESDLAMQKLDQARIAGLCLKEFKRKCGHGEFEKNLNDNGIAERTAQTYMSIARDWDIISQASREIVTAQSQTLSLNWATKVISESKRALKSAAPPADPDCWRTPNTKEQPIVGLVTEALGGEIWCDPCADAGHRIPARVHYNTSNNGLNARNLWTKTVFINPPFSDPLPWAEKCCASIARGECSQAIMLLKAGTLSNQGTGKLIKKFASGICHWRGRIHFLNDHGIAVKGSDFDCVLVYFGHRFDKFQETFETFGTVSFIENHYSSVNKKHFAAAVADKVHSVDAVIDDEKATDDDLDEIAKSLGLDNKKSALFPDKRDVDREVMERCDPHTADDRPFANVVNVVEAQSEALAQDRFETAKKSCLNEYITAISGNLSDFSDEQIAFLAKIINEESAKRICGF